MTQHAALTGAPEDLTFDFSLKRTPAGPILTLLCPVCGAKLGAFMTNNRKSRLPREWWKHHCQAGGEELDA